MSTELRPLRIQIPKTIAKFTELRLKVYSERYGPVCFMDELVGLLHSVSNDTNGDVYYDDNMVVTDLVGNDVYLKDIIKEVQEEIMDMMQTKYKGYTYLELRCTKILADSGIFDIKEIVTEDPRFC